MNRITFKNSGTPCESGLRPSETRLDKHIRALFLATIALGAGLLVAACYHMPPNLVLGGTGLGVIGVSMVAYSIHDTRVYKRPYAQPKASTTTEQSLPTTLGGENPTTEQSLPATLEGKDLATLTPREIHMRLSRMTQGLTKKMAREQYIRTRNSLNEFINLPQTRRGAKISKEVAEFLILYFGFNRSKISRMVKPEQLSAYQIHDLLTLSPEKIVKEILGMTYEEIMQAREHLEENLKTVRISYWMYDALTQHFGIDIQKAHDAIDPLCDKSYSLLEVGFHEIDQLLTATPEQLKKVFEKMTSQQKVEAHGFLKKNLGAKNITEAERQLFAVAWFMDPHFTQIWIEAFLSATHKAKTPTPKPVACNPPPAPQRRCADKVEKIPEPSSRPIEMIG